MGGGPISVHYTDLSHDHDLHNVEGVNTLTVVIHIQKALILLQLVDDP